MPSPTPLDNNDVEIGQGPDLLTDPTSSRGDFHLGVPDAVGSEFVSTRLGDQDAKVGLSLGHPL
ncbi:hypothetical protein CR513_01375, partial [Mucuna pruriens]